MNRCFLCCALLCCALFVLLAGCGGLRGTLDEAGEMISEGGERVLRSPMRPVRGATRVLVLAFDGVSDDALREALADSLMPRLSAYLGAPQEGDLYAHAYAAPDVLSVLPSETAAGWTAVYTGRPPAESGVIGNEWFDRDSLATYAPVPLSVGTMQQTLEIYTDSLLSRLIATPTLFERADVRAHVAMGFVYRGADLLTPPDLNDFGDLLEAGIGKLTGDADAFYEEMDDDTWEGVERGVEKYGLPDLQVAYFPGTDLALHAEGGDAQREYLRGEIDPHVGRILDLYREHGALASTYVVIVADHGHTPLLDDDRHSLDALDEADEPPALLDSLGLRRRDFSIEADSSDFNVVMTYDEAFAMVYLADGSTCPQPGERCDWSRGPRFEEDVLPVARAFRDASDHGAHGGAGLEGALDLVFVRVSRPADGRPTPFRVLDGDRPVPIATYLARHPRPDLVELERRLEWLTDGPLGYRAGDILLLAKSGPDRPIEERFYFNKPQRSGHGGAAASDGRIPLVLARESMSGEALQARLRAAVGEAPTQLDVTDLILHLLAED